MIYHAMVPHAMVQVSRTTFIVIGRCPKAQLLIFISDFGICITLRQIHFINL